MHPAWQKLPLFGFEIWVFAAGSRRPMRCQRKAARSVSQCGAAGQETGELASRHVNSRRMRMKISTFFTRVFTWWNGQTFGTQVWTSLYGERVGEDEFGNQYFRTKGGKIDPALGFERRWVIYNGYAEASAIPPSWHGWIHHTVDVPPTDEKYVARAWQKPHRPNPTGTPAAQRPTGSTLAQGRRPKATGDYKAWTPGH
jgi:NADH:ubiquinone oxidoreductase subunit